MSNDDLFSWDIVPEAEFDAPIQKAPFADCANCPLVAFPCVPSHTPPGSAPEDIELIIVGEAPGYYEVKQQEPFVGPSGQLLYAVFDHIGIAPNYVWKTNAVLCRPPNNDLKKYPGAIDACSKRLEAEINAIPCNTIAALGGSAVTALDKLNGRRSNDGILKRRGQYYDLRDREYLATLHPAFVLRSTGYISQFVADLRSLTVDRSNAEAWLETTQIEVTAETRADFLYELSVVLEDKRIVAFDVETPNLISTKLLALGLAWTTSEAWIVPGEMLESDPDLRELLARFFSRARLVAHNGKFDQRVLAANGLGRFNLEADTMLLHYMLDEQKGTHGLKQLLSSLIGIPDYEAQFINTHFRSEKREAKDYSAIPRDDLYTYLAIDCVGTLALHNLLAPIVDNAELGDAPTIAIGASNALQYTEDWGIKIDRPYLQKVLVALEKKIEQAKTEIQSNASELARTYRKQFDPEFFFSRGHWINPAPGWLKGTKKAPDPFIQFMEVLDKIVDGVSLGSWQQMQVLLYDILHLKHTKKLGFKTDPRSTNQEALDALPDHPFVRILQDFRRLDKIRGTYVVKLLELADDRDRVHINFNIHGTETGRLSANDGLHGIPRPSDIWGRAIRGSFIAEPGHTFVIADYSQAELRIFAALSKEPFLLEAYNNGEDVHGNTTKILFPNDTVVRLAEYDRDVGEWIWSKQAIEEIAIEYDLDFAAAKQLAADRWKELRTTAKNVNFGGLVYLGGASGVAAMIRAQTGRDISEKQLAPILSAMLANIPTGRAWQMDQFRHARDHGFVQSRFGNKRRFMLITEETLDEVKKASVNAPIQNGASQLTLLSGITLIGQGFHVIHFNHDQLMIECPIELAERVAQKTQEVMQRYGEKYYPEVKWKADIEIGSRWYNKTLPTFEESNAK